MRHVLLPRLAPYRAAPAAAPSTVAAPLEDVLVTLPKGSAVARSCRFARALNDNPDDEATPYGWFVPPPLGPPAAAVTDCDDAAHCVAPYIDPPAVRHNYVTDSDVMLYDMGRVATIDYLASKLGVTGVRALRQAFPIVEGAVRRESDLDIDRRLFESMLESGLVNAVVSGWYHETLPRAQSGGIHRREAVALALHTLLPNTQCGSPISRQPLSPRPSHWTPPGASPPTPKRQATGARMRGAVAADEWKGIRAEVEEAYYRDADQLLELLSALRDRYPEAYMQWIHGLMAGLLLEAQNVGNAAEPPPLYHTPRRQSAWDASSPPSHASTAAGATPLDEDIGRPSPEDAAAAIQMREFFHGYDPDMMALRSLLPRLFSHLRAKADAIEHGRRLDFHSN